MIGLDKITQKIVEDATSDAEAKLAEARKVCSSIDADYAARAEALRTSMLAEAEKEASGRVARIKSSVAIERRNAVLAERSALVDEAFSRAAASVRAMSDEDYRKLLSEILASVLTAQVKAEDTELKNYGDGEFIPVETYEVMFNESDAKAHGRAVVDMTAVAVAGKLPPDRIAKLRLSERHVPIDGGLILRYGDVEVNCSLSMIFSRLRETAEGDVYEILFKTAP